MKKIITGVIQNREQLSQNIFKLVVKAPEITAEAKPGQFVNIYPNDKSTLLPRPISICDTDGDLLSLVIAVVGSGTAEFSDYKVSQEIRLSSALGNGFDLDAIGDKKDIAVVGGGVGIPPMLMLAKVLSEKYNVTAFLGYRSEVFLTEEFEKYCQEVHIATDSGEAGFKGNVVQLIKEKDDFEYFLSCGPKPMLKALTEHTCEKGIPLQVSLEERMGCGYGACVGCVCKIKDNQTAVHKRVCTEGPVFMGSEVIWE